MNPSVPIGTWVQTPLSGILEVKRRLEASHIYTVEKYVFNGIRQATPAGEMVDLRVKAEAAGLGKRGAAERAAALRQLTSRRLSLRDPLAPRRRSGDSDVDIGRSLPCNFTQGRPSLRLGCPGHVSWRTRDEPRYERNCRRVDRFAQAHDSAWLR